MAITTDKTKMRRREFTWTSEWDDGNGCKIVYNSAAVTSRTLDELRALPDDEADGAMRMMLSATLLEWEVLKDDGSMWPTDPESLKDLPLELVSDLIDAIGQHTTGEKNNQG